MSSSSKKSKGKKKKTFFDRVKKHFKRAIKIFVSFFKIMCLLDNTSFLDNERKNSPPTRTDDEYTIRRSVKICKLIIALKKQKRYLDFEEYRGQSITIERRFKWNPKTQRSCRTLYVNGDIYKFIEHLLKSEEFITSKINWNFQVVKEKSKTKNPYSLKVYTTFDHTTEEFAKKMNNYRLNGTSIYRNDDFIGISRTFIFEEVILKFDLDPKVKRKLEIKRYKKIRAIYKTLKI